MSDAAKIKMRDLARYFVRRSAVQGWTGKTRDRNAVEFFVGAMVLSEINADQDMFNALGIFTGLVLCTRGFSEVEKLAKED